jgi:regulator of protease activity HflC (stomatin/prohibitin superfamily)
LEDIRQFVDRIVAEAERISERAANGENVRLDPHLKIEAADRALKQYRKEARRLTRRPGLRG